MDHSPTTMMTDASQYQDALLTALRDCYDHYPSLAHFAPLPECPAHQPLTPASHPAATSFLQETDLLPKKLGPLQQALIDASPYMAWRTIYRPPADAPNPSLYDFSSKLGCFAITGDDSPFASQSLRVFMVYMPAGVYYPWHTHPAEELYFVISGSAIFRHDGAKDEVLTEGKSLFHESDLPHAIETTDQPFLSLAIWRNHLTTPPTLLDRPK